MTGTNLCYYVNAFLSAWSVLKVGLTCKLDSG